VAGVFRYKEHPSINPIMKKSLYLAASLLALNLMPGFGQPTPEQQIAQIEANRPNFTPRPPRFGSPQSEPPALTKFNLDFPGGTPKELVAAIVKAMGKPLNVIIPDEDADTKLPPLKMNDVNVAQLFNALASASSKQVAVVTGTYGPGSQKSYSTFTAGYGFKTEGEASGGSVWYFHADKPSLPPMFLNLKSCRFYQLTPYLDSGLTVDDITTAIRSGWDMLGDTADSRPQISFHKETKLLIAVGEPDKLEVIDNVLKALQPRSQNPNRDFQDRLKEVINNSAPPAPAQLPPGRPLPATRATRYPAPVPNNLPAAQPDK
jgi:hypothetical protein